MKARVYLMDDRIKVYDVTRYDIKVDYNMVIFMNGDYVVAIFNLDKIIGFDFVSK